MIIRAAMVQFMLEQAGYATNLYGNPEDEVSHVRLLRRGKKQSGTLSIALEAEARKMIRSRGTCLAVRAAEGADAEGADAVRVLEAACDAIQQLQSWDIELKDALASSIPLDVFTQLAERVLPYPYGFYDTEVAVLGASSNFATWARDVSSDAQRPWDETLPNGTFPIDLLADLVEDADYQDAARLKEPFYYRSVSGADNMLGYCLNVFNEGEYAARLVFMIPQDAGAGASGGTRLARGAEQLAEHFLGPLSECFMRYTGRDTAFGNQHDALHALFRDALYSSVRPNARRFSETLAAHGWQSADRCMMVRFVFFDAVKWESAAGFICQHLERHWPRSCALHQDRSIVWVVNVEGLSDDYQAKLMDTVLDTVRTYACKAGISDVCRDVADPAGMHAECEAALALGQARNPHQWYYEFADYKLDFIVNSATGPLHPRQVVSRKLLALAEADVQEGSEYVETLRAYLAHNQNATHTADALYMHRTSLLRRIERMERIANLDLSDPDEVLHLMLSLKLLETENPAAGDAAAGQSASS